MKHINFQKIKIKNFLSVGEEPVVVSFNRGLNIITGINKDKEDRRNGVGKSTIADAVYFAVFGDTLRDLKKDHIINNINKKGCEVELEVNIQNYDKTTEKIKIIRTLEPSKCYVFVNDEDKTRDSITNTTNYILKKFSCTPEIFQNCVIMTVNNTVPFMAKKKQEKRKFIEDIFNLSIFSNMLNELKVDINEKKKSFEIENTKYDEGIKTLSTFEKQKNNALQERERKLNIYLQRQRDNKLELEEVKTKLKEYTEVDVTKTENDITTLKKAKEKFQEEIDNHRHNKTEKTVSLQQLTKQYNSIGTDEDVCKICLRKVEEHDREYIEKEKHALKDMSHKLAEEIKLCSDNENKVRDKITLINNKIIDLEKTIHKQELNAQQHNNFIQKAKQLEEWLKMLDNDIKDLESSTLTVDKTLEDQKEKIALIKHQIETLKSELNMLDVVKFVVSEEGVKSYVVKKILKLFNSRLAYYLKKMDANCMVTFNEYFEEEIIDDKGKPCSYFNFSGAERKNIDLACLFTFMDMRRMQGDVCFNFSIYDELFDSSLDEKGVELVISLLKERIEKYKECAMVISHRKESIKASTGEVIFLEKSNGITRRVDFLNTEL
jgi:DNA repair exonuclease SbcCD ATPase subunit